MISQSLGAVEVSGLLEAQAEWLAISQENLPANLASQKLWDKPLCKLIQQDLLNTSPNPTDRARLLAVFERESGLWLNALPSANTGTLLDKCSLTLAVNLRLGVKITQSHSCICGESVDELAHHGLSCHLSAGRISRHASHNDTIRRALASANIPAKLEPNGIIRSDGKRPDGLSLIPWRRGRCLVGDATCVDTLAPSHLQATASRAGAAADNAEILKKRKYLDISGNYIFTPIGFETMGPWGPEAKSFIKDLSTRLNEVTGDRRAGSFFSQRLSLTIQRGNVASLLGTMPHGDALEEI